MKKILLVMLVTFHSLLIFGQGATTTIPNLIADPGTLVVPVNVAGFNNIGSIGMYFEYDPAVVTYLSFNSTVPGLSVFQSIVGTSYRIGISYIASGTGLTLNGTLVNIVFEYSSASGSFNFLQGLCEVTDRTTYANVPVLYTNGSVNPTTSALISIPQLLNQTAPTNGLQIPLNVDFSNITEGVNSFTFVVEYDGSKLVYQNTQNVQAAFAANITITPLTSPTRLAIVWVDAVNAGSQLDGKLLDMVFNYTSGSAALVFNEAECAIADHNVVEVPGVYTDGLVTQASGALVTVTAGTSISPPGTDILIPVTVMNFTNVGAFDLFIDYNLSVLSFLGLENINPLIVPLINLNSNINSTGVGINWMAETTQLTIPSGGKLFDLKFHFNSGSTPLTFDQALSVISDFSPELNQLTANYINGAVSQTASNTATAIIPSVLATPGTLVEMPVNVTGFTDLAAFDLVVSYDNTVLTAPVIVNINPVLNALPGSSFSYNATGGKLYISWINDPQATGGANIVDNSKLFDMKFSYVSGTSTLVFDPVESVVSKWDYSTIDVTYTNGSIGPVSNPTLNLKVFLEGLYNTGTLQMNKAKDYVGGVTVDKYLGTVADLITVELHDAANYATVIYQAPNVDLNQDGTASVVIPVQYQGSYYLTVKQRNHIETVSFSPISFAGTNILYNFTNLASQAYGNNQKLLSAGVYGIFAGDINQDGFVNATDRSLVNSSVIAINKGYIATDVNGDGGVNATDRSVVNSAVINIIKRLIP